MLAATCQLRGSVLALWRAGGAQEDLLQYLRAESSGLLLGDGQDGSEHVPDQPSCSVCCKRLGCLGSLELGGRVFWWPLWTFVDLVDLCRPLWTFVDLCGLGLRLESRKWVNTSVDYCNQQLEKRITEDLKKLLTRVGGVRQQMNMKVRENTHCAIQNHSNDFCRLIS